jgi:septal ring factor EnvC (AmiA/AmiB activator)
MNNVVEFIKFNWKTILKGLFAIIVLWYLIQITTVVKMGKENRKELKQLDEHIKMVEFQQELIQSEIETVNEEIKVVENRVETIKETKIEVGNEFSKKISDASKYGHVELDRFFADRYKELY